AQSRDVVDEDRYGEDRDVRRHERHVERAAREQQHRPAPPMGQREVEQRDDGEEQRELEGVEEHTGRRVRSGWGNRFALVLLALLLAPTSAFAQADTIGPPIPLFTYRDAVLAGSVVVATVIAKPFDERIAARLQDSSTQDSRRLQRMATFVRTVATPGSYYIGISMYAVGRLSNNEKLADLGLHGTEALVVGELVAGA